MKKEIIDKCKKELEDKKTVISKDIAAIRESMGSDTKSSAGDKYETGREMMNQEKDKLLAQVANIDKQLETLHQVNLSVQNTVVGFGALIKTSIAKYFIAISYGKITLNGDDIFLISAVTPIAKTMMDKKVGDQVFFNGKVSEIEDIL